MEDQSKEIERLRLQVKNLEKLSSLGMLSAGSHMRSRIRSTLSSISVSCPLS